MTEEEEAIARRQAAEEMTRTTAATTLGSRRAELPEGAAVAERAARAAAGRRD